MPSDHPLILLIEDEPAIADMVTYALSTDGFQPIWCSTGYEGLARFRQSDIALVILDVGLPDLNGFDLFKQLRAIKDIPVIFLTARSDEIDRVVGLELGADDYVPKPFSPREVSARVKTILRRWGGRKAEPAPASSPPKHPFVLDAGRMRIRYFEQELELSRYEYLLLKVLIQSPGRVYTREQLKDLVWDEPESSLERTVDAHIKQLRAKLRAAAPEHEAIITHRSIGYSLKENW